MESYLITWWARRFQAAGLDGGLDALRARACLDLLLDQDSRPRYPAAPSPAMTARITRRGRTGPRLGDRACPHDQGGRMCLCNAGPPCKQ
jgi:hypothetical protein